MISASIKMALVRLQWREKLFGTPKPHLLRGAIADQFPEEPMFHQHQDGAVLYRYPLIQYRWRNGEGVIAGFGEGAETLVRVPFNDIPLALGNEKVSIENVLISCREESISIKPKLVRYHFVSPWLPFNQKTYEPYLTMDEQGKANERDRMAVANLLLMLKGLGIRIEERLYATVEAGKSVGCRYKNQNLLGFYGNLLCNIDLPDGVAIGRAVSHGYGWIERC